MLCLIIAVAAAAFLLLPRQHTLERRWQRQAGFDPLAAFPPRDANASARRLETLAAAIGIRLASTELEDRPQPAAEAVQRQKASDEALKGWLDTVRTPAAMLGELPAISSARLETVRPTLLEIRRLLLEQPTPRWELHLEQTYKVVIPNLLGHLQLHRLLLAAAAIEAGRQASAEAASWQHAAWRLRDVIVEDPLIIEQLIAYGELRDEMTLLRALEQVPAGTMTRLARQRPREGLERALRLEAWIQIHALRTGQLEQEIKPDSPVVRVLFRAFARHGAAQITESMEQTIRSIESRDLHGFDAERFTREQEARIPRWNVIARLLLPNFLDSLAKAQRYQLDIELTRNLLEARRLLATRGVDGLRALPAQRPTAVRGFVWLYELGPDALIIRSNGELPTTGKHKLPLEVQLALRRPS